MDKSYQFTEIYRKGELALWEIRYQNGVIYRITDDGSGYCNSIEEMCEYFDGNEIELVKIIVKDENDVMFVNKETLTDCTYTEYLNQFQEEKDFYPIYPYVDFKSYDKAKKIWDLLTD